MKGQVVSHYRLVSKLGAGAFGEVWEGVHNDFEEMRVAVKLLHMDLVRDEGFIQRLKRECLTLHTLQHANIVGFRELVLSGDRPAMVMELVEGEDAHQLSQKGPLSAQRMLEIGRDALMGLSFAHKKGVIHRDIKPSNLFVCRDGTSKLLDFGIAKAADGSKATKTGTIQGTLQYMAPEVFSGDGGTQSADLYALGLSFVELLKGAAACPDGSMPEQMAWHLMKGLESEAQVDIPEPLWAVLQRLCAKDVTHRFANADEALQAWNSIPKSALRSETTKPSSAPMNPSPSKEPAPQPELSAQSLPPDTVLLDSSAEGIPQAVPRAGHSLPPETVVLAPSQPSSEPSVSSSTLPPKTVMLKPSGTEKVQNDGPGALTAAETTSNAEGIEKTSAEVEPVLLSSDEPNSAELDDSPEEEAPKAPPETHGQPSEAVDSLKTVKAFSQKVGPAAQSIAAQSTLLQKQLTDWLDRVNESGHQNKLYGGVGLALLLIVLYSSGLFGTDLSRKVDSLRPAAEKYGLSVPSGFLNEDKVQALERRVKLQDGFSAEIEDLRTEAESLSLPIPKVPYDTSKVNALKESIRQQHQLSQQVEILKAKAERHGLPVPEPPFTYEVVERLSTNLQSQRGYADQIASMRSEAESFGLNVPPKPYNQTKIEALNESIEAQRQYQSQLEQMRAESGHFDLDLPAGPYDDTVVSEFQEVLDGKGKPLEWIGNEIDGSDAEMDLSDGNVFNENSLVLGSLEKSLIDGVIKDNFDSIRQCYQSELSKGLYLEGKIVVKFVIASNGFVSKAEIYSSTMGSTEVESCIVNLFKKFTFPEPSGGGIVVIKYPFVFSPN